MDKVDFVIICFTPVYFYSYGQVNINFELEKLRIELRHARGMYAMAQSETNEASRKVRIIIPFLSSLV